MARPTAGGDERTIPPCVTLWTWAATPRGIVHVDCGTPAQRLALRYWGAATGEDRPIAALEAENISSVSVSADGQNILYATYSSASELMMVENFR